MKHKIIKSRNMSSKIYSRAKINMQNNDLMQVSGKYEMHLWVNAIYIRYLQA